jgi:hypothetical protein
MDRSLAHSPRLRKNDYLQRAAQVSVTTLNTTSADETFAEAHSAALRDEK